MRIERRNTKTGQSPYAGIDFRLTTSEIRNPDGSVVFRLENVEVPEFWSQVASDVLAQKYFRKAGVAARLKRVEEETVPSWLWRSVPDAEALADLPESQRYVSELSAKQVFDRLAGCWTYWGWKGGYFTSEEDARAFSDELRYMLAKQMVAPNSPQWFNTGLHWAYGVDGPGQGHYYVDWKTGKLTKSKSSYEHPQPHACFIQGIEDDLVNEGGIMDLWVREARLFKYGSGTGSNFSRLRGEGERLSGGGRSSGLMSFLKIGDRAAGAIKSGGTTRRAAKMVVVDADHPDIETYIDWKVKEDFLRAVETNGDWNLINRTNKKIAKTLKARELWEKIGQAAWASADPGLHFNTTMNDWHTCKASGEIRASNPCSEYMFLDDTACNLASANLITFYSTTTKRFDVEAYEHLCRLWTIVLEISVMMTGVAYATSAEMAKELGPFPGYKKNAAHMLRVIRNHRRAAHGESRGYEALAVNPVPLDYASVPQTDIVEHAKAAWDKALATGELHGYRNAQTTVVAPTGTIGLVMDCDTTGIEPDFALVKFKKLAGGGYFKIINQAVPAALRALGYGESEIADAVTYAVGHGTLSNAPGVNHTTLKAKGFTDEAIAKVEKALPTAFDIKFAFNKWTLGEDFLRNELGVSPEI